MLGVPPPQPSRTDSNISSEMDEETRSMLRACSFPRVTAEEFFMSWRTRKSRGMAELRSSQQLSASATRFVSASSWACSVINSDGLSLHSLSSFSASCSSSFTSILIAPLSAVFRPPSAIRLDTSRSVMNLRPAEFPADSVFWLGSRVESARARSSAVGSRIIHEASSTC